MNSVTKDRSIVRFVRGCESTVVKIFILEFQRKGRKSFDREILSGPVAMATARRMAIDGMKPIIRRVDVCKSDVRSWLSELSTN